MDQSASLSASFATAGGQTTRGSQGSLTGASPVDYSFRGFFEGALEDRKKILLHSQENPDSSRSRQHSNGSLQCGLLNEEDFNTDALHTPVLQPSRVAEDNQIDSFGILRDNSAYEDLDPAPLESNQWTILKKIWYPGLTVFYTFTVSLFIFPGFLTVACAKGPFDSMGNVWYRLILQLIFNCCDLLGRFLAPYCIGFPFHLLWVPALIRSGLIPLFWLSVYNTLDWWWGPAVFTLVLGVSNGLLGSLCMMRGPGLVDTHEREMGG